MKSKFTTRTKSILTNSENLENLHTIENFPVFIGQTEKDEKDDLFCDLVFDICLDTGVIQIRNLIDPEIIYSEYHSEAIGGIWTKHHSLLSDMVSEYVIKNDIENILEIGGSNGDMSKMVISKTDEVIKNWTIVDPGSPDDLIINKGVVNYKKELFENIEGCYDMVFHSHTIEHMYDVREFLKKISESVSDGKYHIFSIPNLHKYMENLYVNVINFEHTIFLTEEIVDVLLSQYGFDIIEKKYFFEHSIFYVTQKKQETKPSKMPNFYVENKRLFLRYISHMESTIKDLNHKMEKNGNSDIYLFGAHVFSQFLISSGLNSDRIKFILDNSEIKHDKRLYGTNKIIKNPNKIDISENSNVILTPSSYKEEITEGLLKINPTIKIIE